jgi:hypothetical protein
MSSLDEYLKSLANPAEKAELKQPLPEKLISQIVLLRKTKSYKSFKNNRGMLKVCLN